MSHLPADFHRRLETPVVKCRSCGSSTAIECNGRGCFALEGQDEDPLGIVQNISRPAPLCACFPGACRGGEVIDGKLANGSLCQSCL